MDTPSLIQSVEQAVRAGSKERPVHWTTLTECFVEGHFCTEEKLVDAMNALLLPRGSMHGANHRYWFE